MKKHEILVEEAIQAIRDVFADQSVGVEKTRESLELIRDTADEYVQAAIEVL